MKELLGTALIVILAFLAGFLAFWFRKFLLAGVALALLLAGCDSGLEGDSSDSGTPKVTSDAGGLRRTKNGGFACTVPSPTGDEKSPYGTGKDVQYFMVITDGVTKACNAFKAANPTLPVHTMTGSGSSGISTVGIDCSDAANDFQGSSGQKWCVVLTASDGISACGIDAFTGFSLDCLVEGMSLLGSMTNGNGTFPNRDEGLCSTSGVFLGWQCITQ